LNNAFTVLTEIRLVGLGNYKVVHKKMISKAKQIEIKTGMPSYLGFVCDYDNTLHIIYRNYYYASQNYYSLCYQRKQDTSFWEPVKKLTIPAYPGYAGYYHKVAIDKLNNLFIASPGYYSAEEPLLNTDYSFLLISSPEYPWVFTMTPHFEIIGE
jgi:hypothetical protein